MPSFTARIGNNYCCFTTTKAIFFNLNVRPGMGNRIMNKFDDLQLKPLNVINFGLAKSDTINRSTLVRGSFILDFKLL